VVAAVHAERPIQPKDDASLVIVGTVQKIAEMKEKFGDDGIETHYTADVKIDKVESGTDAKEGQTIKVKWFHVTKKPSQAFPGAYGHSYPLKEKSKARFWLVSAGAGAWEIIYNPKGADKAKKKKKSGE
jgi:hypothetical protein